MPVFALIIMGEIYEVFEEGNEVDRFEVRDLRVKTRFAIDNCFYDEFTPIFGPTVSVVYIALVRHANKEQKTWPSQSRIAAQLGLSREWVGTQLQLLEYFGLIKKVRLGKMCTNRYYLVDEKQWRRDYDAMIAETHKAIQLHEKATSKSKDKKVMRTEFTSLMSTPVGIRAIRTSHQMLVEFTSNRKDKQSKDTQRKGRKVEVKKSTKPPTKAAPRRIEKGQGRQQRVYFDAASNSVVTEFFDEPT